MGAKGIAEGKGIIPSPRQHVVNITEGDYSGIPLGGNRPGNKVGRGIANRHLAHIERVVSGAAVNRHIFSGHGVNSIQDHKGVVTGARHDGIHILGIHLVEKTVKPNVNGRVMGGGVHVKGIVTRAAIQRIGIVGVRHHEGIVTRPGQQVTGVAKGNGMHPVRDGAGLGIHSQVLDIGGTVNLITAAATGIQGHVTETIMQDKGIQPGATDDIRDCGSAVIHAAIRTGDLLGTCIHSQVIAHAGEVQGIITRGIIHGVVAIGGAGKLIDIITQITQQGIIPVATVNGVVTRTTG